MPPDNRALPQRLETEMLERWQTWESSHGPVLGPWVAGVDTPVRRLRLLVLTVLAAALESVNPTWSADLDYAGDDAGALTGVILIAGSGARVRVLSVSMTARLLRIGSTKVALNSRRAGEIIVRTLADQAAGFCARPAR